ncbi:MAG: 3-dehydroquinate synthase [Acidobacteria bacterium]|nr:3-dehydroquinate synthase [Acidobacteriota bacterium]
MAATRIEVTAGAGAYPVVVGAGALDSLPALLDDAGLGSQLVVVSSPIVWELHGRRVATLLKKRVKAPVLIPDGERAKTLQTLARIYEALIKARADRSVTIIALGGGVIGDMVGFAAASYLRGVRLVHIPTTLMAQVDSAIGGKVGVNHALGKNLIGAFHPPKLVLADPAVLSTLPRREFRAGLYEVIKYGVIATPSLITDIHTKRAALFAHDAVAVEPVVRESCRIKAAIVSADERESGERRTLNFGHTVGHALEAVTDYRRFRHGEAVAYGMIAAAEIGAHRGVTPARALDAIRAVVTELGPLPPVSDLRASEIVAATKRDKKVVSGTLHFVVSTGLGTTSELTDVTDKELKLALKTMGIR